MRFLSSCIYLPNVRNTCVHHNAQFIYIVQKVDPKAWYVLGKHSYHLSYILIPSSFLCKISMVCFVCLCLCLSLSPPTLVLADLELPVDQAGLGWPWLYRKQSASVFPVVGLSARTTIQGPKMNIFNEFEGMGARS